VNAAKVVGHGVGDVVAHAHRSGIVMRGAKIIPASLNEARAASRALCVPAGTGMVRSAAAKMSNGSAPAKRSATLSEIASISFQVARSALVWALPGNS